MSPLLTDLMFFIPPNEHNYKIRLCSNNTFALEENVIKSLCSDLCRILVY